MPRLIGCFAQIHCASPVTSRNLWEYMRWRRLNANVKMRIARIAMLSRRINARSLALIPFAHAMNAAIVIPARWASTRFPGKPLARIAGVSLIRRVYERATESRRATAVFVATDDDRIEEHVRGFG